MSLITIMRTVIRPQLILSIQVTALLLLASCGGGGGGSEPVNSQASSSTTPIGNSGSTSSTSQTTNTTDTTNAGTGSSGNDQGNDQSQPSNADSSTLFETDGEMNIRLQAPTNRPGRVRPTELYEPARPTYFGCGKPGLCHQHAIEHCGCCRCGRRYCYRIHPGRTRTHCASAEA